LSEHTPGAETPPICDYEGSDYQARFWENQGREYEDLAERIAIRHLLPPSGTRLLEIGTGFGRLVDLYQGYEQIVMLDYSRSMLQQAQHRLGRDLKYTYVAADLYRMPLADGLVDATCMVRVMHHVADVPAALRQIRRVLRPGGVFILEFANKYHLKSLLRYALRRQDWSPFDPAPVEFVALNYDFHPRWMRARLQEQGLQVERVRTVSHFRVPLLKRLAPARALAALDGAIQWSGRFWPCAPSIFVRARRAADRDSGSPVAADGSPAALFCCPSCGSQEWQASPSALRCLACGARWAVEDGIYDFKEPL
jgi:ubiquinone/menaquinone biosynthesis C-methylase UbiE